MKQCAATYSAYRGGKRSFAAPARRLQAWVVKADAVIHAAG